MVRGIHRAPCLGRLVIRTPMRKMAAENQQVALRQLHGNPVVRRLPSVSDASTLRQLNIHSMRAGDNFYTAVGDRCSVDGQVCGGVLDVSDVVVGGSIKMSLEAIAARELVVDLVLEQQHFVAGKLRQNASQAGAVQQGGEGGMVVGEVFRPHELAFAGGGDFVVWHPLAFVPRERFDFTRPFVEVGGTDEIVFGGAEDEVALCVEVVEL